MERFEDYLNSINIVELYPEFGEVFKLLYQFLFAASKDHADTFTATHATVSWSNGDNVLGKFPLSDTSIVPTPGYDQALLQSLQYDDFLRTHLVLVHQADGNVTCRLVYEQAKL